MLHQVPDALTLGDLQFLLKISEHLRQMISALFCLVYVLLLPGKILIELCQHIGRVVHHLPDIGFQQLVQFVGADVMGGTAGPAPAVVGAAGIGAFQVAAAHGEHGTAAVAAHRKPEYTLSVFLDSPVVGRGALFSQGLWW